LSIYCPSQIQTSPMFLIYQEGIVSEIAPRSGVIGKNVKNYYNKNAAVTQLLNCAAGCPGGFESRTHSADDTGNTLCGFAKMFIGGLPPLYRLSS
jgi:hypothetical protein